MLRGGYSRTTEDGATEPPGIEGVMLEPGRTAAMVTVWDWSNPEKRLRSQGPSTAGGRRSRPGGLTELALKLGENVPGHQTLDAASQGGHLAHQPRRNVEVVLSGHHEDGLDFGSELAIHVGHLEFVLEVRDGSQAAEDDADALAACVLNEQALEVVHLDARIRAGLPNQLFALLDRKQRQRLVGIVGNRDDEPVEYFQPSLHEAQVTVGQWIEGSGIQG